MKASHKHHYLPQHYLRGFTDSDGVLHVYDKKKDSVFASGPAGVFFENDLNTIQLPDGGSDDFLEEAYSDFESQSWASFDRISKSDYRTPVTLFDKMDLFFFLLFLYWRLPAQAPEAQKLLQTAFEKTGDLNYFQLTRADGSHAQAPQEIIDRIKGSAAFEKAFRQVLPFAPFFKDRHWALALEHWHFFYTADKANWYVVGDNPIVSTQGLTTNPVHCLDRFVFPVSGRIVLTSTNRPQTKDLEPGFAVQFGAAMLESSRRFVAGAKKDFLLAVIKYHRDVYVKYNKTNREIDDMFSALA